MEQPAAPSRPLHVFTDYTPASGKGKAFSFAQDLKDMAAIYVSHPSFEEEMDRYWHGDGPTKYLPAFDGNPIALLTLLENFQFPAEIRSQALRNSRHLVGAFDEVSKLSVVHNLVDGQLDRRKFSDLAQAYQRGKLDTEVIRPYRRIQTQPVKPPVIAVVASGANTTMWTPSYIPSVYALVLGVQWACEAAGLEVIAALTRGHCRLSPYCKYTEAINPIVIARPGLNTSLKASAVALNQLMWRNGANTVHCASLEDTTRIMQLQGVGPHGVMGQECPSRDGGNAVNWARQVWQADIVIAIGDIKDIRNADVQIPKVTSIETAIKEIAAQAAKLKRGQS